MIASLGQIATGENGTDQTVKEIGSLINASRTNQNLRFKAMEIIGAAGANSYDQEGVARALYNWIQQNINYVFDPAGIETIQSPEITLKIRGGDCDDHTILYSALAQSVNLPVRIVVTGENKDRFKHIYPETQIGGRWVASDTTGRVPFGRRRDMGVNKIYNTNGVAEMSISNNYGMMGTADHMGLSGGVGRLHLAVPGVKRGAVEKAAYDAAYIHLENFWNNGSIDMGDVRSYLRVIDEGNSQAEQTIVKAPMRQAVIDFIANNRGRVPKKFGLSGAEGLDGFLSGLWKAVKKGVGAVVGVGASVLGIGGQKAAPITIQMPKIPQITPQVTMPVTPAVARAGVDRAISGMATSPIVWVGLALLGAMVLLPKLKGR